MYTYFISILSIVSGNMSRTSLSGTTLFVFKKGEKHGKENL